MIPDAREGLKAAVSKVLCATWQHCRVHFMRNVLDHAGKSGRRVVSAFVASTFAQGTQDATRTQWRTVADQIRPRVPKLATIMDAADPDVLALHRAPPVLASNRPLDSLPPPADRRERPAAPTCRCKPG